MEDVYRVVEARPATALVRVVGLWLAFLAAVDWTESTVVVIVGGLFAVFLTLGQLAWVLED